MAATSTARKEAKTVAAAPAYELVGKDEIPDVGRGGRPHVPTPEDGLVSALNSSGKVAKLSVKSLADVAKSKRAIRAAANRIGLSAQTVEHEGQLYVSLTKRITRAPKPPAEAGKSSAK